MKAQNTWSKGLNSDISKLKSNNESYLYAENFRIVSQEGSSTYALENTKGQTIAFKLPSVVNAIYKLDPQDFTGNIVVVIGSSAPTTINNFDLLTPKTIQESLLLEPTIASQVASGDIAIQYNNSYIVIVGLDSATSLSVNGVAQTAFVDQISSPKINGAINIKDKIVLFSTPNQQNPVQFPDLISTGQIWVVRYDENTNLVSGLVNDTLVPSEHLKYHQNLNFTLWRKISGEGRWEYTGGQKVYFTDFFNSARLFNIASANSFATPIEVINMKPLHSTTIPVIQSINDGGFIKCGRIQYFYQLYSNLGTETTFSTASNLISLSPQALSSTWAAQQGGTQGEVSGKSVSLKIEDLDTNYENIKVGYILWETEDLATVRLFYEAAVPPSGEVVLTHSGSEDEISITLEQYRALQAAFDKCKGFAQKKNILLAFNTTTDGFDVDVDCRTYRFSGIGANNLTNAPDQTAYLYQKEDVYGSPSIIIDGVTSIWYLNGVAQGTDWTTIPEEHDLINPYNQENPLDLLNAGDWFNNSQFKYQSNGTILGGSGALISYTFVNSPLYDADTINSGATGLTFGNPLSGVTTNVSGAPFIPGNGYTYPIASGLNCSKNPLVSSNFNGYARGEVYRMADVFYNLRGQQSFTKWIGDIKFPLHTDGYYAHNYDGTSDILTKYELGIVITLDTSQQQFIDIQDDISGWEYVRVKRTTKDKTRLGTGILNTCSLFNNTYLINTGVQASFGNADIQAVDGTNIEYATFESPNFKFNIGNGFIAGDHIRYVGFLGCTMNGEWGPATVSADSGITKYYYQFDNAPVTQVIEIAGMFNCPVSSNRTIIDTGTTAQYSFINMGEVNGTTPEFKGWGGYTHLLSSYNTGNNIYAPSLTSWNPGYGGLTIGGFSNRAYYRPYVSYERYLTNQYNGNSWESRLGQEYIGTNHFQPWDNTQTIIATEVFGGDTLCTHFGFMKFDTNDSTTQTTSGWDTWGANGIWQLQYFPCEVDFDLDLRKGFWATNKNGNSGEPYHDEFIYNTAYSQQNTSQAFFSIPYNFREINENPYRIWASQQKFDGEIIDAWAQWRSSDFGDAEGTFGPINNITLNTDRVFFYQDYAIAVEAVKEQQLIGEGTSTALVLGEGSVLQRYDYITKNTGCKHQWGVINTPKGTYHVDVSLRKIFLLSEAGDKFGLTDLKGLNVEFQKLIQQRIKDTDLPLINGGVTIHGGWNPKHNEVFFTLLDNRTQFIGELQGTGTTITYNELTETFDSFHKYAPSLYHRNQNHFLSINPGADNNTMWEHDTGSYNVYYGVAQPSTLKFTINLDPATTSKVINIIEIISQVNSTLADGSIGADIPFETISTIRVYNEYQDSGVITVVPQVNIKKRFRSWRWNSLRDYVNFPTTMPRLRDKTFTVEITYSNPNNHRLVMNDVISELDVQPY